jgi:hypothetical protein
MTVRRAAEADYEQIVELQMRNLITNLKPDDRGDGFLSGYFDAEMLRLANENLAVMVCGEDSDVYGFICLTTPLFEKPNAVAAALVASLPEHNYENVSLDRWKVCMCGPVCIEREQRGKGYFEELYKHIPDFAADCDLAVTLVAVNNGRSLAAHRKVGMQDIFQFSWNDREFSALARKLHD